jgi:signal transduction histidine kinase
MVSVEDNGRGIPDDFKRQIFNRMLKGTAKAKGMGLGLYLVRTLVNSYGGRVWVEDRVPGDHTKGAKFVVMLPAIEK